MLSLHTPVLLTEMIERTQPKEGDIVLDATLGLGGHAEELLKKIGKTGKLIGLDTDERNLKLAKDRLKKYTSHLLLRHSNFRKLSSLIEPESVDIVLFDLGVSSPHFDDATRGFSYDRVGSLDMRLDTSQDLTAAEVVNNWTEAELRRILRKYGEIRSAERLAQEIVKARNQQKLKTTTQLAEMIEPKSLLSQVFQAIRIAVNDELNALREGLGETIKVLKPGGRLAVISFHSLEDKIVKEFLLHESRDCICPKELPICRCQHPAKLKILTRKPITPTSSEIRKNSRSRSAKLRVAQKINCHSEPVEP